MPTTTRIDKDPNNRLDASFMNNFHEVDVERRLMLFVQHHRNCNTKYQDTIAYRRLAEEQKSKALLDKFKDSSKKDAITLSQDKSSKPKSSTVKPEQQQASSDYSKSQQASLPESNKETFSSEHKQELCAEIEPSLSAAINRNISPLTGVVKQEEGGPSSSSCVHRPTDTVSKSSPLDLSSHQQHIHQSMGVCDSNGTPPYSEVKNTSSSSRKGSLGNMTFVGLSGNPDDELNLNAKDFIENTAITLLPSVDADNQPDPLPMKKPVEPKSILPQQPQSLHSSSNRNDDVLSSAHETDVERGMTEFSKVMDLIIKREEGAANPSRHNSGSSFNQLSDLRLQTASSNDDLSGVNGTGSSPPPYPGTNGSALKRAAQQLASTKDKYLQQQQQMAANINHPPKPNGTQVTQPPTPMAAGPETNWQQQQQQHLIAAKQQQMMAAHQMQQQSKMRGKVQQQQPPQQQQQPQQQYDIFKSASPNVTIVSRDTYRSTAMTMQQQQSPNVAVHPSSMAAMNHQMHMMHANPQPVVQTMGQPSLMHQQPVTISMSRNQPQVYAPMPSAGPYVGAAVDPHTVNRSNSIAFSGIDSQHFYQQQQQRRHSLPPQIPAAVHQGHWQQQQEVLLDGGYNSAMAAADTHHQYSMAGQKRSQSYLPPQVAVAKRNSFQHMPVSHAMVQASYQQPLTNTMMNGELGQPIFNSAMVDPLLTFDGRGDVFGAPL